MVFHFRFVNDLTQTLLWDAYGQHGKTPLTLLFGRRTLNNRIVTACLMGDIMWAKMTLNARYGWTYGDNGHQQNLGTNSSRRQRPRVGILGKDVGDIRHGTCPGASMLSRARGRGIKGNEEGGELLAKKSDDGRGRGESGKGRERRARDDIRRTKTGLQRGSSNGDGVTRRAHPFCFLFLLFIFFSHHDAWIM